MPNISIIVPFKNGEKYLERCINNIKKQRYKDYEMILIDDNSTDNSRKIIEKYKNDKKIKYFYLKDDTIGVGKARNYGIENSRGKYILFVDVDDIIENDLLKNMKKYINEQYDVIKFKMIIVNDKENKTDGPVFLNKTGEEAFNELCFKDKYLDSPCLYLIKKELFDKTNIKFPENMYHEDFGLIPILIAKAKKVASIDYYGYRYYQTKDSIMRNENYINTLIKVKNKFEHYNNIVKKIEKSNFSDITKENMKEYYSNSLILSLKDLDKKELKFFKYKIKQMKVIENFKVRNVKKMIKKLILKISLELYLRGIDDT